MKTTLLTALCLPLIATSTSGYAKTEQVLSEESFHVVVYAADGAVTCRNRVESDFGKLKGSISILNDKNKFGGDRVSDNERRVERISFFSMALPEDKKCADYAKEIPRNNDYKPATRKVTAVIQSIDSGKSSEVEKYVSLQIIEEVKIKLSESIEVTGSYVWQDFVMPETEYNSDRDVYLQLADTDGRRKEVKRHITISQSKLQCAETIGKKGKLTFDISGALYINTKVAQVIFPTKEDCLEKLNTIAAEMDELGIEGKYEELLITRTLAAGQRKRTSQPEKVDALRTERVEFYLFGLKFFGISSIQLW